MPSQSVSKTLGIFRQTVKKRHTAKCIYDCLVAEKGFVGGESAIRKAVNDLRKILMPIMYVVQCFL